MWMVVRYEAMLDCDRVWGCEVVVGEKAGSCMRLEEEGDVGWIGERKRERDEQRCEDDGDEEDAAAVE